MTMRLLTAGILLAVSWLGATNAQAAIKHDVNIRAQGLGPALADFARQTGIQVVYAADLVEDLDARALTGSMTPEEALTRLLAETRLKYEFVDERTVTVILAAAAIQPVKPTAQVPEASVMRLAQVTQSDSSKGSTESQKTDNPENKDSESPSGDSENKLEEVVVTGTHLRGVAPSSSALKVYDRQKIDRSGTTTMDQFARTLLENFSSIDATSSGHSNGQSSGFDQEGTNGFLGAGFNLHGLGPGATLTLLNGRRLAPAGNSGQFVDVSMIPLSAVDRVEVLSDGASAIYGADAIAGVVNVIMRRGFSGAETSLQYGGATRGGDHEFTGSQLFGTSWSSGDAMLSCEHNDQDGLLSTQREFVPDQGAPTYLVPKQSRDSVFVFARQRLAQGTELSADAFYSDRDFKNDGAISGTSLIQHTDGRVKASRSSLGVDRSLHDDWRASLNGGYSTTEQSGVTSYPSFTTPDAVEVDTASFDLSLAEADLRFDGSVFEAPAGRVKVVVGAGARIERLQSDIQFNDAGTITHLPPSNLKRKVSSIYTEWLVPLIGENNARAGATALDLTLAGRYEHYDDFGSTTNPKIGLSWAPSASLHLRTLMDPRSKPPHSVSWTCSRSTSSCH